MVPWKSAVLAVLGAGRHIVYKKKQQTRKTASPKARTGLATAMVILRSQFINFVVLRHRVGFQVQGGKTNVRNR